MAGTRTVSRILTVSAALTLLGMVLLAVWSSGARQVSVAPLAPLTWIPFDPKLIDPGLLDERELAAHPQARLVDRYPVDDRIRPGEIDVLEDAGIQ